MKINFPDLRKYFFANTLVLTGCFAFFYMLFDSTKNEFISNMVNIFFINCILLFLLLLEILIRWMAQKINPNLEIPKVVKIIYNLIFMVGFIASLCFIFFLGYVFLQYSF